MIPTAKGYFSGAGLFEIGIMNEGIEFIQSNDIDPDAIEFMDNNKHYFSHSVVDTSIEDLIVKDQPNADISVFTYPCKRYSTIADIHGVRTGENLFLHAFRHFAIEQPEAYVIENVPGIKKFRVVMEAMTQLPQYYVNVFCPVNASYWLPQDRKRLIIIGTKKPFSINAPTPAKIKPTIKDIIEENPVFEMPDYVVSRINGKYRDRPIVVDPNDDNAIAPTCLAHYAKDLGTRLLKDDSVPHGLRPFTVREYARLQGVPEDIVFKNKRSDYKLIGNGVPIQIGSWVGKELMRYFN